jgi:excisionase family DNA binding protein
MTDSNTQRWKSVSEIADHLGVAPVTIYRWLEKKSIPAHKVGRLWKFQTAEVDEWVLQGGACISKLDGLAEIEFNEPK